MIRARIPSITSLINKSIDELEGELDHLGRPVAIDAGVRSFTSVSCIDNGIVCVIYVYYLFIVFIFLTF